MGSGLGFEARPTFVIVGTDTGLTNGLGLRLEVDVIDRDGESRRRRSDELFGEIEVGVLLLDEQVRTLRRLLVDADNDDVVVGALDAAVLVAERLGAEVRNGFRRFFQRRH